MKANRSIRNLISVSNHPHCEFRKIPQKQKFCGNGQIAQLDSNFLGLWRTVIPANQLAKRMHVQYSLVIQCECLFLGYGVFAAKDFQAGDFIMEYAGTLLDARDADAILDQTYIYFF